MGLTVAIVGRPNVGKSALFNRLVGRRIALVDDTPGVTRDRRVHAAKLRDLFFDVVDTAGLEERDAVSLSGRMRAQTELAIDTSDLILFVIDARTGVTPSDSGFAELVRRSGKPVVLVANKMEFRAGRSGMLEAYSLGLGDPVPVSAEHGDGMADLRDAMVDAVGLDSFVQQEEYCEEPGQSAREGIDENTVVTEPEEVESYDETRPLFTAIVGRPNAGKSTLINALVGEQRMLTGPEAGITRDSISVDWTWRERTIRLFDTAGMRRKSRVNEKLEKLSVADGLRAIRFAEVVVIVFDATVPFEKQDLQIVDLIVREGRAPVIAFNKWDLIEDPSTLLRELHEKTNRLLPQVRGLRTVPVSAETGRGLDRLMEAVIATHRVWNQRVSTGRLNRWLEEVQLAHPPPAVAGRRLKVKYISQIKTRPPGFAVSCSRPDAMPQSYVRYLVNGLREAFDLSGVPIRLVLRASDNPYAGKAKKSR